MENRSNTEQESDSKVTAANATTPLISPKDIIEAEQDASITTSEVSEAQRNVEGLNNTKKAER